MCGSGIRQKCDSPALSDRQRLDPFVHRREQDVDSPSRRLSPSHRSSSAVASPAAALDRQGTHPPHLECQPLPGTDFRHACPRPDRAGTLHVSRRVLSNVPTRHIAVEIAFTRAVFADRDAKAGRPLFSHPNHTSPKRQRGIGGRSGGRSACPSLARRASECIGSGANQLGTEAASGTILLPRTPPAAVTPTTSGACSGSRAEWTSPEPTAPSPERSTNPQRSSDSAIRRLRGSCLSMMFSGVMPAGSPPGLEKEGSGTILFIPVVSS